VNLANIDFKLIIEFNGKKWLKTQKLNDLKKKINDRRKSIKDYYHENILSSDRRRGIHDALLNLMQREDYYYKYAYFSKDEQEMREYLFEHFRSHGERNENLEDIVNKAYKCGLFQPQKKTFFYLKVDPEKYNAFTASLGNKDESSAD
jgi:hypothetical protein